jgi:hypothetical protein
MLHKRRANRSESLIIVMTRIEKILFEEIGGWLFIYGNGLSHYRSVFDPRTDSQPWHYRSPIRRSTFTVPRSVVFPFRVTVPFGALIIAPLPQAHVYFAGQRVFNLFTPELCIQFSKLSGRFVRGDAIRIPSAVRRRVDAAQNNPTCGEPYKAHSQSRVGDSETRSSRNLCWL